MPIEEGAKFQISQEVQRNFNSAEFLTVTSNNGITIQFTLADGKGYGSMPVDHLNYLLKRSNLTKITSKKALLQSTDRKSVV